VSGEAWAGIAGRQRSSSSTNEANSTSTLPSKNIAPHFPKEVSISSLGLSGIAVGTLVVQGVAILTSAADRRFAMQAQELQTSERFREVAEFLKDVLLLTNADFSEALFVNRAYEAIWGRTVESLYAAPRSWLEGVHPDDRQQVQKAESRAEPDGWRTPGRSRMQSCSAGRLDLLG
jgi:PAS domain-containing protein